MKIKFIIISIIIMITFKIFIFDIVTVSGKSMENTIHDGQIIIINKLAYGLVKPFSTDFFIQWSKPEQNDVISYLHNNKTVIKRCIAIENTPLEFSINKGYSVIVNNLEIPLTIEQYQRLKNCKKVPKSMSFAIGDNYSVSIDSRNYGFVSNKNITGKVLWK